MHQGYYIEKDLIYQADVYSQTFLSHQSEESSALQKEVEEHAGSFQKENFLTKAILMNLKKVSEIMHVMNVKDAESIIQVRNTTICVYGLLQKNGSTTTSTMNQL